MGANRAGDNLRRRQKRHRKNVQKFVEAQQKRESGGDKSRRGAKG